MAEAALTSRSSGDSSGVITGDGPPGPLSYYPGCADGCRYVNINDCSVYVLRNSQWFYEANLRGAVEPDSPLSKDWLTVLDAEYTVNGEPLPLPSKKP